MIMKKMVLIMKMITIIQKEILTTMKAAVTEEVNDDEGTSVD